MLVTLSDAIVITYGRCSNSDMAVEPYKTGMSRRQALRTLAGLASAAALPSVAATEREWTVMVYVNGKNNLEPDALANFHAMSSVGSTEKVTVLVQLGRPKTKRYTDADGNWSGVYRFVVKKGMAPLPRNGVNVEGLGESIDMGSTASLRSFVKWARTSYPAKRYMSVSYTHLTLPTILRV